MLVRWTSPPPYKNLMCKITGGKVTGYDKDDIGQPVMVLSSTSKKYSGNDFWPHFREIFQF